MALIDLHVQQINCKKGKRQNIQLIEHKNYEYDRMEYLPKILTFSV